MDSVLNKLIEPNCYKNLDLQNKDNSLHKSRPTSDYFSLQEPDSPQLNPSTGPFLSPECR
jgi:hypothetical protein